jgi:hypothetical protein
MYLPRRKGPMFDYMKPIRVSISVQSASIPSYVRRRKWLVSGKTEMLERNVTAAQIRADRRRYYRGSRTRAPCPPARDRYPASPFNHFMAGSANYTEDKASMAAACGE